MFTATRYRFFGALPLLGALLGGGAALAQSHEANLSEFELLRVDADKLLLDGRLEDAEFQALRSLELDGTSANEAARRVLIDVYISEDRREEAEGALAELGMLPKLPAESQAWLHRATQRIVAEQYDGAGQAAEARQALMALRSLPLTPAEEVWWHWMDARVTLRQNEQDRRFAEGRVALDAALKRPGLLEQERRWLEGATLRLDALEAEWSCAWDQAGEKAASIAGREDLRPSDRAWARAQRARVAVWLSARQGDFGAARAALESLSAPQAEDPVWVAGFSIWLDYQQALSLPDRQQDSGRLEALWPVVQAWQQEQPACARLAPPAPPAEPRAWVELGALGGAVRYQRVATDADQALPGSLCGTPCLAPIGGVQVAGLAQLKPHLAVWGRVGVDQPWLLDVGVQPWSQARGHASLAYTSGAWSVGAGPRLVTGVWAWKEADVDNVQTFVDGLADLSARWAPAGVDLTGSVAVGRGAVLGEVDAGWRPRGGPLRVGLDGALLRATRPGLDAGAPDMQRTDARVGLGLSWRMEVL